MLFQGSFVLMSVRLSGHVASILPPAGSFSEGTLSDVLGMVLVGFLFVFGILAILAVATAALGKLFKRLPVKETSVVINKSSAKPGDVSLEFEETDPHYIPVIAAAIHCALDGRKHRIVSIRTGNSD